MRVLGVFLFTIVVLATPIASRAGQLSDVSLNVLPCNDSDALPDKFLINAVDGGSSWMARRAHGFNPPIARYDFRISSGYYEAVLRSANCSGVVRFVVLPGEPRQVSLVQTISPSKARSGALAGYLPLPGINVLAVSENGDAVAAKTFGRAFYFDQLKPGAYRLLFKMTPCCLGWQRSEGIAPNRVVRLDESAGAYFEEALGANHAYGGLSDIVPARDGSVWVAEYLAFEERLAHIKNGSVSEFTVPIPRPVLEHLTMLSDGRLRAFSSQYAQTITISRDGALQVAAAPDNVISVDDETFGDRHDGYWIYPTIGAANAIAHINANGAVHTFELAARELGHGVSAEDGSALISEPLRHAILQIDEKGSMREYVSRDNRVLPWQVYVGSDRIWFRDRACGIGYVDAQGQLDMLEAPHGPGNEDCVAWPTVNDRFWYSRGGKVEIFGIHGVEAAYPFPSVWGYWWTDTRQLWYANPARKTIDRRGLDGTLATFSLQVNDEQPTHLIADSHGTLWYLLSKSHRLGKLDSQGHISEQVLGLAPPGTLDALQEPPLPKRRSLDLSGNVSVTVLHCLGGFGGIPRLRARRVDLPTSRNAFMDGPFVPANPVSSTPMRLARGVYSFDLKLPPGQYEIYADTKWCHGQVMVALLAGHDRRISFALEQWGGFNGLFDHDHVGIVGAVPMPALTVRLQQIGAKTGYAAASDDTAYFADSLQRTIWYASVCANEICGELHRLDLRAVRPGTLMRLDFSIEDLRGAQKVR